MPSLYAAEIAVDMMVKGAVCSRTIYPVPDLRTFTDIDLLIAPEALPQIAHVLDQADFRLAEYDRDTNRQEWKWLYRDNVCYREICTDIAAKGCAGFALS